MNETDIRKYAQLMGELGLTGLEIKNPEGSVVRLERTVSVAAPTMVQSAASAPVQAPASDPALSSVKSPMVGVFYRAPAENAEPYVKVGDTVKKGAVLCLIEAMKMMNEIVAEEDGVIAEICVENGQVVDFDRELFRIRR